MDRLCGLVVRVLGANPEVPSLIPCTTRFSKQQWLWNGAHSALVNINEELLKEK
jgi:hypothetical protein